THPIEAHGLSRSLTPTRWGVWLAVLAPPCPCRLPSGQPAPSRVSCALACRQCLYQCLTQAAATPRLRATNALNLLLCRLSPLPWKTLHQISDPESRQCFISLGGVDGLSQRHLPSSQSFLKDTPSLSDSSGFHQGRRSLLRRQF